MKCNSSSLRSIVTTLLLTLICALLIGLPATAAAAEEGEEKAAEEVTFISIFFKPSAKAVVMWILLIGSIVMLTIIIEMFVKLRKARMAPPAVLALLRDSIASGNYQQALDVCNANPCFLSRVFAAGIDRFGHGRDEVNESIHEATNLEAVRLKGRNNYLSVIGVVSPMIGLTGTVLGMMKAFSVLSKSGAAQMGALSGAISEVLIATAAGLIVAIPAFLFFYYFKNVTTVVMADVQIEINKLLNMVPFDQLHGMQFGQGAAMGAQAAPQGYYQQPVYQ